MTGAPATPLPQHADRHAEAADALERIVRDVRAMHFHPLPGARQQIFSGRVIPGLDPVAA